MTDTETLKKALFMIQKLKKRLHEQGQSSAQPIAIIGMSCRLPQANTLDEFWSLLNSGTNTITPMPEERWNLLKDTQEFRKRNPLLKYNAGYLKDIDAFDAYFFGISPREAVSMDPQQRILLEVSYESLEDAGLTLESIKGSNMGVFSSLYTNPLSRLQPIQSEMDALLIPTGSAISIASNRLSYLFDLHGPSLTLDTACSSSLVGIHMACLSLQAKQCHMALVNGININLSPTTHSALSQATMLSPSGQCHTFDERADGYVQGEGAGSIILKPLSQALKDNDRVYAVIGGSAVNQDGKTNGLTAPNGIQQEQLLKAAYQSAKINPKDISYVECHGTGTFLGDPIEAQALGQVIGKNRAADKPCWISSVKTNIGHLEPAAGIISTIKTALVLNHGQIPPHLNFATPNPHIPLEKYRLNVPASIQPLPRYNDKVTAGVSGFGFGGTNAHIVLQEHQPKEKIKELTSLSGTQELFTLSAKDSPALNELVKNWCDFLEDNPEIDLAQVCYNLHLKRNHYSKRIAIITHSIADLHQKLESYFNNHSAQDEKVFIQKEERPSEKITDAHTLDLVSLAKHYINHGPIDWHQFEKNRSYQYMDMPLNPWQRQKYWPQLSDSNSNFPPSLKGSAHQYPMRGKHIFSPLPQQQFEFEFDTQTMPEIHDTFGILHAGFYIEMLGFAFNTLCQTKHFHLEKLQFLSPLFVPDDKHIFVQLIIESTSPSTQLVCFYSHDGSGSWVEHAKASALIHLEEKPQLTPHAIIKKRSPYTGSEQTFYQRITEMGMPAGDTIRWAQQYWLGENEIWCEFRKPKTSENSKQFTLQIHPGVIDACIQTLFMLVPKTTKKPYIASQMGKIIFYALPESQSELFIYSVLNQFDAKDGTLVGQWYLLNQKHEIIAACHDLCLKQLGSTELVQSPKKLPAKMSMGALKVNQPTELLDFLIAEFAQIFSMPPGDIDINCSLHDLGMDSLMAMTIIRTLENRLNVNYSLPMMMKGPSISELAKQISTDLPANAKQSPCTPPNKKPLLWLANRDCQPKAKLRLFCFPYGGGGASIYRQWQQALPSWIEVCPIQLPGRENRLEEPPMHDINALVQTLAENLEPLFDLPFAFLGHSFGALVAFKLTHYLRQHRFEQPVHLFASAYPDPSQPSKSLENLLTQLKQEGIDLLEVRTDTISQLSDKKINLLTQIFKENGIVDYSDERMNKSIIEVLLPIFVSDMNIVNSYTHQKTMPFTMDATIFLGEKDTWVLPEEHQGWSKHFSSKCEFHTFNAGHLFIREEGIKRQMIKTITHALEKNLSTKNRIKQSQNEMEDALS